MSGKNYTKFTDTPVPDGHFRIYDDHTGRSCVDVPEFAEDDSTTEAILWKIWQEEIRSEMDRSPLEYIKSYVHSNTVNSGSSSA
jgi:hypothetical protein